MRYKCRVCKKDKELDYIPNQIYIVCSSKCLKEHRKKCKPSTLFPDLAKELNKIDKEVLR